MKEDKTRLLIGNAKQMLTMRGENNNDIGLIESGWLYAENGIIKAIGTKEEVLKVAGDVTNAVKIEASDKVVMPGFIDSHTHTVFGGSRVKEYAVKLTDERPETLEKLGIPTGIYASVNRTKDLPLEVLALQAEKRMRNMLLNGTTTLESKSGYGLTLPSEMKMLEVNNLLSGILPIDIVSCFLGGHGWTEGKSKDWYVDHLCKDMIPQVAAFHMAAFNDVWVDEGHFTASDAYKMLEAGKRYGLRSTLHAEAYSYIGGTDVAIKLGAASCGHLNYTPDDLFPKMRDAGVVGILLPGTDFAVKHPRPAEPRKWLDCGMTVGLATNCNPGCWNVSMQFTILLATRQHGMSVEEALRAATYGSARALTLDDRGVLDVDKVADILLLDVDTYEDIAYRYGSNHVDKVIKKGRIVVEDGKILEDE